jgi:hypothetical protein
MNQTLDKIRTVVERLEKEGVIHHGQNFCFATAELVQYLLAQEGVDSHLVEVELTILRREPPGVKIVGHEDAPKDSTAFPSHMVTVTDTEPSYLIDLSIGGAMVTPAETDEFNVIAVNDDGNVKLIYKQKIPGRYPEITQKNILARIDYDRQQQRSINTLKWALIAIALFTAFNFGRGIWEAYQVWLNPANNWGPEAINQLDDKIDRINQQLEPEQLRKRLDEADRLRK